MQHIPSPDASDSETIPDERVVEPAVLVSMFDDHLVISPPTHMDLEATEVVVSAAASAVSCGTTVMIDLDPDTASDDLIARRPMSAATMRCITSDGGPVGIPSAGHVRLRTRDSYWTIDLTQGRLCRSEKALDPHFVRGDEWTHVHALWVTSTDVTALTADGTYLSTHAAWATRHETAHLASA